MALRCLLVDDSARFLKAARALLECEGIVVVGIAMSSLEALRLTEEHQPDVMLLDINLGSESGFELARQVDDRARMATSDAPWPRIILISTHPQEEFEDLIEASPAVGFLDKSALSAKAIQDLLSSGVGGICPAAGCRSGSEDTRRPNGPRGRR